MHKLRLTGSLSISEKWISMLLPSSLVSLLPSAPLIPPPPPRELNTATVFFVGAVSLFFMIQTDVWCPWVSRDGHGQFEPGFKVFFLLFCWKKKMNSDPSSLAAQVTFRFLTILIHTSFMCFISALTWWFWHFNCVPTSCFPSDWGISMRFGYCLGFIPDFVT